MPCFPLRFVPRAVGQGRKHGTAEPSYPFCRQLFSPHFIRRFSHEKKKDLLNIFSICLFAFTVILCTAGAAAENRDKLTELEKYVFEVETYTSLDYDFAGAYFARNHDN